MKVFKIIQQVKPNYKLLRILQSKKNDSRSIRKNCIKYCERSQSLQLIIRKNETIHRMIRCSIKTLFCLEEAANIFSFFYHEDTGLRSILVVCWMSSIFVVQSNAVSSACWKLACQNWVVSHLYLCRLIWEPLKTVIHELLPYNIWLKIFWKID